MLLLGATKKCALIFAHFLDLCLLLSYYIIILVDVFLSLFLKKTLWRIADSKIYFIKGSS